MNEDDTETWEVKVKIEVPKGVLPVENWTEERTLLDFIKHSFEDDHKLKSSSEITSWEWEVLEMKKKGEESVETYEEIPKIKELRNMIQRLSEKQTDQLELLESISSQI